MTRSCQNNVCDSGQPAAGSPRGGLPHCFINLRMSWRRHPTDRSEIFLLSGYLPERTPSYQVDRDTGYNSRTSGNRRMRSGKRSPAELSSGNVCPSVLIIIFIAYSLNVRAGRAHFVGHAICVVDSVYPSPVRFPWTCVSAQLAGPLCLTTLGPLPFVRFGPNRHWF
jgi:hypothetical protein